MKNIAEIKRFIRNVIRVFLLVYCFVAVGFIVTTVPPTSIEPITLVVSHIIAFVFVVVSYVVE